MKFKCIKSLIFPCFKKPYDKLFIKDKIYNANLHNKSRKSVDIVNELGISHNIAYHWLWWRFDNWWKEYFQIIK